MVKIKPLLLPLVKIATIGKKIVQISVKLSPCWYKTTANRINDVLIVVINEASLIFLFFVDQ